MTTKENIKCMVLYTDGGCRPNPGHAGSGFHGFSFEVQKSVRGVGHTTHAATANGYNFKNNTVQNKLSKEDYEAYCAMDRLEQIEYVVAMCEREERVTVNEFFDFTISPEGLENTNNTAEMIAATHAILLAIDEGISVLTLRIDSQHVINGITEWVDGWRNNGWRTKTGQQVTNVPLWEELVAARDAFRMAGNTLRVVWVKGHSDDIGNNSADNLATTGVYSNQGGTPVKHLVRTEGTSDYWGSAIDHKHPMISHRYSYFVANDIYRNSNTYYLGSQGKEADMIGKKSSEAGYAVVNIDKGEPMLDMVVDKQCSMKNELQSMYLLDVEALYGSSYRYLNMFGGLFLFKRLQNRFDLWTAGDTPITRELQPPVIAMRAIDSLILFSKVLDDFLNDKGTKPVGTDITDLIYDRNEVRDKKGLITTETKIKSEFSVGQASLDVMATVEGIADPVKIILTAGIDIADRNMFKRIEHLNPKVHVITWGIEPLSFHYATVVQTDDSRGIWGGPYSNVRVLETPRAL